MVATASPSADNLPVEATSFVGRRRELTEARRMLSATRLLTLTGAGGVGKTRLAQRVAAEVRRAFPDGVWFVGLSSLEEPELLAETVAATLGLRDDTENPVDRLADYLEDKRLLLVLDNCEHLLDECATLVARLLTAAAGVRVLATSRQVLRVEGEQILPVPPLALPDVATARHEPDLSRYDAVALFVDRASAVLPGFRMTERNRNAVARICQRLDGIPLAIELAAVQLRTLSVEDVLSRLGDRFQLLTGGDEAAGRQQTLEAAIDWGFGLCSPGEQLLWGRLSVFAGGFELEAAEEICAAGDIDRFEVLDLLAGLVEKSIVTHEEDEAGRRSRYHMLATIRQYGRKKLAASGEETLVRHRHRDYYWRLAERVRADFFSPRETAWLTRLQREHANLRVALEFCLTEHGQARRALEIAAQLRGYWIAAGYLREGHRWLRQALALDTAPSVARLRALWSCSFLGLLLGEMEAPLEMLAESSALARRLGHTSTLAEIAWISGVACYFRGETEESFRLQEEALARYRAMGDTAGASNALLHMAIAAFVAEDPRAAELGAESLALCEQHGAQWSKGYPLWIVGLTRWREGDHAKAITLLQEAIERFQSVYDLTGISLCLYGLAWAAAASGRHEWSARLLGASQPVWRLSGARMPREAMRQVFDEQCEAQNRRALGGAAFEAAFSEGASYGVDAAIRCALERGAEPAPGAEAGPGGEPDAVPRRSPAGLTQLTRREWEIAALVAKGLSNKKIAERLLIAPRTADTHVENILNKLGFNSRTRIAAWIAQHETERSESDG
jgi:predicted ATPase/DNA-binding CsgD family transcriptional regulator